jgi:hypothetical protein
MELIVVLAALAVVDVLAVRYGADSGPLSNAPDSHPEPALGHSRGN